MDIICLIPLLLTPMETYNAIDLYLPFSLILKYVASMYRYIILSSILVSRNSLTLVSRSLFSDDTYSGDTFTHNPFITLLTYLVDTPLMYNSTIADSKAFSNVEYLSNTEVVNEPDLISGLFNINSPSSVFNFLFL